MNGEGIKI